MTTPLGKLSKNAGRVGSGWWRARFVRDSRTIEHSPQTVESDSYKSDSCSIGKWLLEPHVAQDVIFGSAMANA
jgi:hypothetical protein